MYNANKGIVVTNSTFTSSAIQLADANNIELVNGNNLEKLKKDIVKNINTNNEDKDELELYIEDIFERAELVNINKDDEKAFQKRLASFGQAYAVKEGTDFYNKEKIQRFIDAFFKNAELIINDEQFDLEGNRKTVEILIKAGIYSVYINEFLQPILEDEQLDENEKMEIINIKVNEYANNDDDGMDKVPKVFALEIFFDFSIDETEEDENPRYYSEEENLEYFDTNIEDYDDFDSDIQNYDELGIEDDSMDFLGYDSNDFDSDDDY